MKLEGTSRRKDGLIISGNVMPLFDFTKYRDPAAAFMEEYGHLYEKVRVKPITFKGFLNKLRRL